MRLLQLEAFFHAALVAWVEHGFLVAGEGVVALEGEIRVRVWYLLDGDDDLQCVPVNYRWAVSEAWKRSRSAGVFRLSNWVVSRPSSQVTSRSMTTSCAV